MSDVTVCIPSIPPRSEKLAVALISVTRQTVQPSAISVAIDHHHVGAAETRNRAIEAAETEWLAFLDDDDELYPQHLERLLDHQRETDADIVWPWFDTSHGFADPFPMHEGRQWNPAEPHMFPITVLVRRSLWEKVGGFHQFIAPRMTVSGEDWAFWNACSELGAKFAHLNERTWLWNYHGGNTSGLGARW